MDDKEVLRRFGLPWYETLYTEAALIAIMRKLLEIEDCLASAPDPPDQPRP